MHLGEDENLSLTPKDLVFASGAGILSSLLAVSLVSGSGLALILAYLAPFPLFLVGLGKGGKAAFIAMLAGIAFCVLVGGPIVACIYAVMNAFPSWLAVRLLLTSRTENGQTEWFPAGNLLLTFSMYGSALFILALVYLIGEGTNGFMQMVKDFLSSAIQTVAVSLEAGKQEQFVEQMYPFFPAMVLVSWMMMTLINAVLAQWVLRKSGKTLRPSPKYGELRLPDLASWVFIACAAVAVIADGDLEFIARNLTAVSALPFFALGLTVVHTAVRRTRFVGALLCAFYLLLLLSVWVALPVIGLGLIEQWIGLRRKIPALTPSKEND